MHRFQRFANTAFAADIARGLVVVAALGCAGSGSSAKPPASMASAPSNIGFEPGQRVLLDAHNAYPERGQYADRLARALSTGLPVAIEQDLYWRQDSASGAHESVVAHDADALVGAPSLEAHFFELVRPLMERALRENRRTTWPLITLNLDFKTNEPAHHQAVWTLLGKYSAWLTTAPRTSTLAERAPLSVGPMLVLTGADSAQRRRFYDSVRVGERLLLFGAASVPVPAAATREARVHEQAVMLPELLIASRASNYLRWVNFPWAVVEEGGANAAGEWTAPDAERLASLVRRAHAQGYWIRFYTLDGFRAEENAGFTASYNFGDRDRAAVRWRAGVKARVDFIATDQYEAFAQVLRER